MIVPAHAALIKLPAAATWTLASDLEVNEETIRLTRLTDFFDFTTDEGLTWEDNGAGDVWGNDAGQLRSANNGIELFEINQISDTRAQKSGFSVAGDFKLEIGFKWDQGTPLVAIGLTNTDLYWAGMLGDGSTDALFFYRTGVIGFNAASIKAGVQSLGVVQNMTRQVFRYYRLERVGTTLNVRMFDDRAMTNQIGIATLANCTTATLTKIVHASSFGGGGSGTGAGLVSFVELWSTGVTERYLSTSPVAEMASALTVGVNIDQIDLAEDTESGADIKYQHNIGAGYTGIWNTLAFMQTALVNTSPATLRIKAQFNSDGDAQGTLDLKGTLSVVGSDDGGGSAPTTLPGGMGM